MKKKLSLVIGVLLGFVVLSLILLRFLGAAGGDVGPQLAGKPASFWIRTLPFEADQGFLGYDHPLEQAGPEIIPLLIQVMEANGDRHSIYRKVLRFVPPPLAKTLPEPDAPLHRMQTYAAFRLGQFGPAASNAVPSLQEYYRRNPIGFGVSRAIQAIGSIGPASASALPTVVEAFSNRQVPDGWATIALLQIGKIPAEAIPHLELQTQKQGHAAGPAAVALWIAKQDTESLERVNSFLAATEVDLQAYTAVSLRFYKELPSETKAKLRALLQDERRRVRQSAAVALAHGGEHSEPVVAALIDGLQTGEFATHCAFALAEIGPAAKEAMPVLKANFDTNSPALCRAFTNAMKAISRVSR